MSDINFFTEDHSFQFKNKFRITTWIHNVIQEEDRVLNELNIIFCSDNYLLQINKTYLNHETLTDIITFDHSETNNEIEGDIFISIDRVKENALSYNITFKEELLRIMIHGVLHLIGYKDKSENEKQEMTEREDIYLNKL